MGTHSFVSKMRKRMGLFALCILSGLLIALQLALPSVAQAASASGPTDFTPVLMQSQVSVVRLVVFYTAELAIPTPTSKPSKLPLPTTVPNLSPVPCTTGLGVLVKSWPTNTTGTDWSNWVLTDGALLKSTLATTDCPAFPGSFPGNNPTQLELAKVDVFANNAYTNNTLTDALLGTISGLPSPNLQCDSSVPNCSGAALLAFHTPKPQPYVEVAPTGALQAFGIALTNAASTVPTSQQIDSEAAAQQYLKPTSVATTEPSTNREAGTPFINASGQVASIVLSENTSISGDAINNFFGVVAGTVPDFTHPPANQLQTEWMAGIQDYYQGKYKNAYAAFVQVEDLNPNFKAATTFKNLAAAKGGGPQVTSTSTTNNGSTSPNTILGIPTWLILLIGLGAGVIVLILLLVLVSLTFGRARARRKRELAEFGADHARAQQIAEAAAEAQRQQGKISGPLPVPLAPVLRCPNCKEPVQPADIYCSHCQYLLAPAAAGAQVNAVQPPSAQPQAQAQANYERYAPHAQVPAPSISEMPTVHFPPAGGSMDDTEKSIPYTVQQLQGHNLSLAVGTRTDPGIKRQHKPNEDSVFAIQGARPSSEEPRQFGLFVVADGMGGHANGQDASRLAIQTIIDFMLPKLSSDTPMNDEAFKKILDEGVQQSNQAVHQRNMEERADMGTTMTAALVVGATAYVANVGDSRTYLYREPAGLSKITHDHSVVASLVDAGIIKPDDIYTHPKRNQIYRSLGEKPYVEVDTFKVVLQPGDKLLLCSDGLWDMVRDPEIQRLMSAPMPDPSKTGKALIQAALDGGGEDNVSVIVVYINETTSQPAMTGVQLLAKPESVTVPNMPST